MYGAHTFPCVQPIWAIYGAPLGAHTAYCGQCWDCPCHAGTGPVPACLLDSDYAKYSAMSFHYNFSIQRTSEVQTTDRRPP